MQKLACVAEISTVTLTEGGEGLLFVFTRYFRDAICHVLGRAVSSRTAWKALALTNDQKARSTWLWPCILLNPWPWNYKASPRDLQNTANAKTLRDWTLRSRVSRRVAFNRLTRLLFFPVNSIDLVDLSRRSRVTTSGKFNRLDRPTRSVSGPTHGFSIGTKIGDLEWPWTA